MTYRTDSITDNKLLLEMYSHHRQPHRKHNIKSYDLSKQWWL